MEAHTNNHTTNTIVSLSQTHTHADKGIVGRKDQTKCEIPYRKTRTYRVHAVKRHVKWIPTVTETCAAAAERKTKRNMALFNTTRHVYMRQSVVNKASDNA
jgi:hypothetical protein